MLHSNVGGNPETDGGVILPVADQSPDEIKRDEKHPAGDHRQYLVPHLFYYELAPGGRGLIGDYCEVKGFGVSSGPGAPG